MRTNGKFYLGRQHDLAKGKTGEKPLLYDPDDLTTHGVVFGMTGSGKTGLSTVLLEEAALNGIPALMIDPKGDMTNTLLHFPELQPEDFEPWVNAAEARREKKSLAEAAKGEAEKWRKGLANWEIAPERIQQLGDSVEFAVYTPGSHAGLPVNILASLQAPKLAWKKERETILARIASTATAILGLVGFKDIDPVKSREHILLANLFENAWSQGKDLELSSLIRQVQQPPVQKLGVLEVDEFFPPKERAELALKLNNILASPSFEAWLEGQPLEVGELLYTREGKPRHSVFTLSHLSDAERMFFVTLLYSAVETWMYTQPGTDSLRALVYIDEIHGFMPPVAEPPSKGPILRLFKQARAFGVAQLVATQNPVDIDYKALSNAGTWFIGKLQAERDKDRLLDGLEGAAKGSFKRADFDTMISALEKRVFLMHNVRDKKPKVFHTRWAMNYLPGPLTRAQIPALNELAGAKGSALKRKSKAADNQENAMIDELTSTRPALPEGAQEVFLPAALGLEAAAETARRTLSTGAKRLGLLYRPALLAQAQVRYLKRTYNLDHEEARAALVEEAPNGGLRWEDYAIAALDERKLERRPGPDAAFAPLEGALADSKGWKSLENDFVDWLYRSVEVQVWHNENLKLYGGPELSEDDFVKLCVEAAEGQREAEIEKTKKKYQRQLKSLEKKLGRERRELEEDKAEASQRKMEEMGTHLDNVIGLFSGRSRRLTTSLTKRRLSSQAQADVEESLHTIQELEGDIQELGEEIQEVVEEIHTRWDEQAAEITQIPVTPLKKDIFVSLFGVAWLPYHRVEEGGREMELAAFEIES